MTDDQGRRFNLNVSVNFTGNPMPGMANPPQERSVEGNVYSSSQGNLGPATRLSYINPKTVQTSVPFEFHDVPMP